MNKQYTDNIKHIFNNFKYDYIEPFDTNYTIAILNGKAGLINTITGEPITDFIYDYNDTNDDDDIYDFFDEEECCSIIDQFICSNNKCGYDFTGDQEYCLMSLNGKWGVINSKGKTLVDFQIKDEFFYSYNVLCLQKNGKWGILDKNLNILVDFCYDDISCESENLFVVCKNGKYGIIDKCNKIIVDFVYDNLFIRFTQDVIIAQKDGKYGIIDLTGNIILPFEYDKYLLTDEDNILALFIKNKTYYYVNKNGEIQLSVDYSDYDNISTFDSYCKILRIEKNGKFGVVDMYGNIIIEPQYKSIEKLGDNFVVNKNLIVDKNNNIIKYTNYDEIDVMYKYGIAVLDDKECIINQNGEVLVNYGYNDILITSNKNIVIASKNNLWGVIDLNNNIIIDFKYDWIEYCSTPNRFIVKLDNKYALFSEKAEQIA